jgi:hypothetical protein
MFKLYNIVWQAVPQPAKSRSVSPALATMDVSCFHVHCRGSDVESHLPFRFKLSSNSAGVLFLFEGFSSLPAPVKGHN